MGRWIDADKLKRRAQKVAKDAWKMKLTAKIHTVLHQFIDWIDEAPTVWAEQDWTPVGKGMPPDEINGCMVTVHYDDPFIGEYDQVYHEIVGWDGEGWNNADGFTIPEEVIAWMPTPKPYQLNMEDEIC